MQGSQTILWSSRLNNKVANKQQGYRLFVETRQYMCKAVDGITTWWLGFYFYGG